MNQGPEPIKVESEFVENTAPEKTEYYDKYLRARADLDNYQKRARFEADRAKEETTRKFLLELLPVWDNFELVATNNTDMVFNSIKNQFLHFFQSQGISIIETKAGDTFNAAIHEVVLYEEDKSNAEVATIAAVFRSGFSLNNKIIRPSQVKISMPKKTSA